MNSFYEKWKSDEKYRTKIKLIAYTVFIIAVAIYASVIDRGSNNSLDSSDNKSLTTQEENIVKIPEKYQYEITINIDDNIYKYNGTKEDDKTTIVKTINDSITNYILQDNEYYIEDNGIYTITTKDEVYDIINYNYINLDTINTYLSKSTKDNNQYIVYLKDIILENNSNDYIVININDNNVNIDYTTLMKEFNSNIEKYNVNIKIEEIE